MTFDKLFDKGKRENQTSKHSDSQTSQQKVSQTPEEETQTSEHSNIETSKNVNTQTSQKETNAQTSEHSDAQISNAKSKNKEYTRTTFYLPKKTHQRLKIASINQDEDMSQIVTRLIEDWLKQSDV